MKASSAHTDVKLARSQAQETRLKLSRGFMLGCICFNRRKLFSDGHLESLATLFDTVN